MASENYGYMAPIKAALDSSLAFLAKSFSRFSQVRFNAVSPGPAEDVGLGRHSRLRRFVPVCRAGDAAETGRPDRGSGQRGRVSAQPPLQRHQRPADRRRRRNEHELLRRRPDPQALRPGRRPAVTIRRAVRAAEVPASDAAGSRAGQPGDAKSDSLMRKTASRLPCAVVFCKVQAMSATSCRQRGIFRTDRIRSLGPVRG